MTTPRLGGSGIRSTRDRRRARGYGFAVPYSLVRPRPRCRPGAGAALTVPALPVGGPVQPAAQRVEEYVRILSYRGGPGKRLPMLLGLLLVAFTGAFTGLLIADNPSSGPSYAVTILGQRLATLNSLEIFSSGIVLALIFSLGLWMIGAAGRRRRRQAARYQDEQHDEHYRGEQDDDVRRPRRRHRLRLLGLWMIARRLRRRRRTAAHDRG